MRTRGREVKKRFIWILWRKNLRKNVKRYEKCRRMDKESFKLEMKKVTARMDVSV